MMTRVMSLAGIIFAFVIVAASGFMNYQYVTGWGSDALNSQVFGAVSVALDGIKAILPFFILWGLKNRKYILAAVGGMMFPALIMFSLISALGFVAKNRNHSTSGQEAVTTALKDTKSELQRQYAKLEQQPDTRGAGVIKQAIHATQQHKRFASSKQCTQATAQKSRTFCKGYFQLKAEYETARERGAIESTINRLTTKKTNLLEQGANKQSDPQAGLIAKLTGLEIQDTQTALSVFIAVLVEMVAAFGLYVSTAHGGNPSPIKATPVATTQAKRKRIASNDNRGKAAPQQQQQPATQEIIFRNRATPKRQPMQLVLA